MSIKKSDLSEYRNVWVFAEVREGEIQNVVIEIMGEGRKLADKLNVELCAVLAGYNVKGIAAELLRYGADKVYMAESPLLENYTTDGYTNVISHIINEFKPEIILYGATHIGRDLAPRIAARIGTGLTADCTKLEIDEETRNLKQTRPAFGGNLLATIICPDNRPQMSTIRPGVMEKAVRNEDIKGSVIEVECRLDESDIRTELLEIKKIKKELASLSEAKVIVAGGLGLGSREGFDMLRKLAYKLDGVVGSSRAAVDAGWIDRSHQVGQTGTTVRADVYIACGISGAVQHLAGMQNSKTIIAVNRDANAPIFDVADYCIVGDCNEIIPLLLKEL